MNYSSHFKKGLLFTLKMILDDIKSSNKKINVFITLDNTHKDSLISVRLKELYPEIMCIDLSKDYYTLDIQGNYFEVELKFNGLNEALRIPYSTILKFEDLDHNITIDFNEFENVETNNLLEKNIININFEKNK